MIIKYNLLKEQEFLWIINSGNAELIQSFLENRLVFVEAVELSSSRGQSILNFLKSKCAGLVYVEFKKQNNATKPTSTQTFFDKLYFQKPEDLQLFFKSFSTTPLLDNIIKLKDD